MVLSSRATTKRGVVMPGFEMARPLLLIGLGVAGCAAAPLAAGAPPKGFVAGPIGPGDHVTAVRAAPDGTGEAFAVMVPGDYGSPFQALRALYPAGATAWSQLEDLGAGSDLRALVATNGGTVLAASYGPRAGVGGIEVAVRVGGMWTRRATLVPPPGGQTARGTSHLRSSPEPSPTRGPRQSHGRLATRCTSARSRRAPGRVRAASRGAMRIARRSA